MVGEELAEIFKKPDGNLQVVYVCNMWMTGFDVPSLSTMYLDKPMKNHTLMQAIARANRVYKDKQAGFIIDYIDIFRELKKALAIYADHVSEGIVDLPIQSKDKLVEALRNYIKELNTFLLRLGIESGKIIGAEKLTKNALLDQALSALVTNDQTKKAFLERAGQAIKVYSAILPHPDATEFSSEILLFQELSKEIRSLDPQADIEGVIRSLEPVLDTSIESSRYIIDESIKRETIDLAKIDFKAVRKQFEKKRSNADLDRLRNILSFKLKEMVRLNSSRID